MQINDFLKQERSKAKVESLSKKQVLETIAKVFADSADNLDVNDIYQHLVNREKLGTTGIGGGIAIPHCRIDTDGKTYCACITLDSTIDFDSVDGAPIDIIFAMLVPQDAENEHLQLLAQLAEMLQNTEFVKRLRLASTDEELFQTATSAAPNYT